MKDFTSLCEKEFVKNLVSAEKRIDGRTSEESRSVQLVFGIDYGCCLVTLGNTRVLAQISCELSKPRESRPSEGELQVNVEFTAMAAPPSKDSGGRWGGSTTNVQPSRQLERTLRDSRCIDLESLCVVAGEKVWSLRVDVHILNHDGNVIECASIAAVAALLHFRRPDVTVSGMDVVVHPLEERDPVPLTLLHWPFCCTTAIFEQGEHLLSDPNDLEERVSEGCVVISMNSHQEVCMLHLGGHSALSKEKLLVCTRRAYLRVKHLTALVKKAVHKDKLQRAKGADVGFASCLHQNQILVTRQEHRDLDFDPVADTEVHLADPETENNPAPEVPSKEGTPRVFQLPSGNLTFGEGGPSSWESLEQTNGQQRTRRPKGKRSKNPKNIETVEVSSGSEEDEILVMESTDCG